MSDGSDGSGRDFAADLSALLAEVWSRVASQVNKLLEAHARFGFFKFEEALNPSLADILEGFQYVDFALTKLLEVPDLQYDEARNALNSKQCILRMKELATALEAKDVTEYERIIAELHSQSKL